MASNDMHHRIRHSYPQDKYDGLQQQQQQPQPTICGLPLKYVSLVTLAVQNAALSIVMHYSRVSTPPSLAYSPASAVLLNEILKGSISFIIALFRSPLLVPRRRPNQQQQQHLSLYLAAFIHLCREVFSPDCWKLSIPAILYVVQNSLQFVAIANLPVASFQVTYQMKILTTAAFSVALLRKKLSTTKWLSLFFLAIGVGIVQIQNAATPGGSPRSLAQPVAVGSAHEFRHVMNPLKGFGAVTAACFTSGLAGVYFEMVLKGSKADLWVRNVQLSLFSLIPALLPILYNNSTPPPNSQGFFLDLFRHFGWWAWATVGIQVFGGLVTAVVIKYSDNILKGFATSLSIVFSFLASVALFDFRITPSFVIGASTVLGATWMYNQPQQGPQLPLPLQQQGTNAAPGTASSTRSNSFEYEIEHRGSPSSSCPPSPLLKSKSKEGLFSIVLNESSPPSSSGRSSPASSSPYYPSTPILPHSQSQSSLHLLHPGSNASDSQQGSVLGLGVNSFMRRKSGGFGGAGSSRNSSTASLTALLRDSIGASGAGLGVGVGSGAGIGAGTSFGGEKERERERGGSFPSSPSLGYLPPPPPPPYPSSHPSSPHSHSPHLHSHPHSPHLSSTTISATSTSIPIPTTTSISISSSTHASPVIPHRSISGSGTGTGTGTHTPGGSLSGSGVKGELGLAENGELVRSGEDVEALFTSALGGTGGMGGTPYGSRMPSRMGSRAGSPTRFR